MYRCGIGWKLAATIDYPGPRVPHVVCDACGAVKLGVTKRGDLAAWLRNQKAPPGWLLLRDEDPTGTVRREDYCPKCRERAASHRQVGGRP